MTVQKRVMASFYFYFFCRKVESRLPKNSYFIIGFGGKAGTRVKYELLIVPAKAGALGFKLLHPHILRSTRQVGKQTLAGLFFTIRKNVMMALMMFRLMKHVLTSI